MAAGKGRNYLNDSKSQVREKLSLTSRGRDEDFSIFGVRLPILGLILLGLGIQQKICENVYEFKLCFDPQDKWSDLDATVKSAQAMIKEGSQKENLELGDPNRLDDLAEWKLYQLYRAARKKTQRE